MADGQVTTGSNPLLEPILTMPQATVPMVSQTACPSLKTHGSQWVKSKSDSWRTTWPEFGIKAIYTLGELRFTLCMKTPLYVQLESLHIAAVILKWKDFLGTGHIPHLFLLNKLWEPDSPSKLPSTGIPDMLPMEWAKEPKLVAAPPFQACLLTFQVGFPCPPGMFRHVCHCGLEIS